MVDLHRPLIAEWLDVVVAGIVGGNGAHCQHAGCRGVPENAAAGAPVFERLPAQHVQFQLGRRIRNLQVVSMDEYIKESR